jgi:hypothetical protein
MDSIVTVSKNLPEESQRCDVKARFASEYEAATAVFSQAVTELRRKVGTSSKEEYDRLGRLANDARVKSEQARLALESHIAEHRC